MCVCVCVCVKAIQAEESQSCVTKATDQEADVTEAPHARVKNKNLMHSVCACVCVHMCTHIMPCPSTVCSTQYVNSMNITTPANVSKYTARELFIVLLHPTMQCGRQSPQKQMAL